MARPYLPKSLTMQNKKLIKKHQSSSRLPRPTGTTYLSLNFQKSNAEEDRDRLIGHIISAYALNGFRFNNRSLTILDMARVLKVPPDVIMGNISKVSENMGNLVDQEKIESTLKTIITLSTSYCLQDRGLIQSQLETLLRAQDGKYKPFISGEVNKALKLVLESNKNLMESYKTFFNQSTNQTNILNIFNGNKGNKDPQSYLSPEEALNMINQNTKQLPQSFNEDVKDSYQGRAGLADKETLDKLFQAHSIGETPDCLEGRTGTEALMPVGLESDKALELTTKKAIRRKSPHTAVSERRGELEMDTDNMPNRADE
jgi:hypothetical protein